MRITGGTGGGRRLRAPRGLGTRPTAAKIRQALFDILADRWVKSWQQRGGPRVLDLYAGTGSLGIEALSRGAAGCIFVERGAGALAALQKNVARLDRTDQARARVLRLDAPRAVEKLGRDGERFELILVDPPYHGEEFGRITRALVDSPLLTPDGVLVIEHSTHRNDWSAPERLGDLVRADRRRYGDTGLAFFEPVALSPLTQEMP